MTRRIVATLNGQPVEAITLTGANGLRAEILTLGASLWDLSLGGQPLVLKHADPHAYADNPAYLGATVGRYANRIAGGVFPLDGRAVAVNRNEHGRQHLHGGASGLSRQIWIVRAWDTASVRLDLTSPDGDSGFPGTAHLSCYYALLAPATLAVEYRATCDAPTVMNLAHHSYFTLQPGADARDHHLEIAADFYTPVDADLIPTGEIRRLAGGPFDFRTLRPIRHTPDHPYDVNFVLRKPLGQLAPIARLRGPDGRITCTLATDAPGLQLYDGHGLPAPQGAYAGLALEPQFFPDSPNQPHFPSARLNPGETYRQRTEYRFAWV